MQRAITFPKPVLMNKQFQVLKEEAENNKSSSLQTGSQEMKFQGKCQLLSLQSGLPLLSMECFSLDLSL